MIELTMHFLVESAVVGTTILAFVAIVIRLLREPAVRTAIIACGLAASVLVPIARVGGVLPEVPLPVLPVASSGESLAVGDQRSDAEPLALSLAEQSDVVGVPRVGRTDRIDEAALASELAPTVVSLSPLRDDSWLARPMTLLAGLYVVIAIGLGVRLLIGRSRLASLLKQSEPNTLLLAELPSDSLSRDAAVSVRVGNICAGPIVCGLWRPTIVLPKSLVEAGDHEAIRYALAHEWSHIVRRDLWAASLANLVAIVLWWNPLAYWLRKQLLLNQDYIADAAAARETDEPADYATFLLSLATPQAPLNSALAMAASQSRLSHRIHTLLRTPSPLLQISGRQRVAVMTFALAFASSLTAMRLVAQENLPDNAAAGATESAEARPSAPAADSRTIGGTLLTKETGEPIANARVLLNRYLKRHPETGRWLLLERTNHVTDENGRWSAEIPKEQWSEPDLFFWLQAFHPDHEPFPWSGVTVSKEWKKLSEGKKPWFDELKMSAATPVTGRLVDGDGRPVPHATIRGRTFGKKRFTGTWMIFETDDDGRFHVPVAPDRPVALCWYPPNFAPLQRLIETGDDRNLGDVVCASGTRLSGQVTDATGDPVEGVWVNARARYGDSDVAMYLAKNSVADFVVRSGLTDANGYYDLAPLPPGSYRVAIGTRKDERKFGEPSEFDSQPVEHTFLRESLEIAGGDARATKDIAAIPDVIVKGRMFDSDGNPCRFYAHDFAGSLNDQWYFGGSTVPLDDGWFEFRVPIGVTEPNIRLMTNDRTPLKFRTTADQPWQRGSDIYLDTIEGPIDTIEVMCFDAVPVTLSIVDPDGQPLDDVEIMAKYTSPPSANTDGRYSGYKTGDISVERQKDGQWKAIRMLPDEEMTITVSKDGYESATTTFTVAKDETRQLQLVLKPERE